MHFIQLIPPVKRNNGDPIEDTVYHHNKKGSRRAFRWSYRIHAGTCGRYLANRGRPNERRRLEVMAEALDKQWWRDFRKTLEEALCQEELVIRAQRIENL